MTVVMRTGTERSCQTVLATDFQDFEKGMTPHLG